MENGMRICPSCGSDDIALFCELKEVPVACNILHPTPEEAARAPRGDISLGHCAVCSLVYNYSFENSFIDYTDDYETSLHFSGKFRTYAYALARGLVRRYSLYGKEVVDIGCGKGEFLAMLCEIGQNRGIGFDSSFSGDRQETYLNPQLRFIKDCYHGRYVWLPGDLFSCRQVLEHIERPLQFVEQIRQAALQRPGARIFFEVPDFGHIIRSTRLWDIIYEHTSYFTARSLKYLLSRSGLRILRMRRAFANQYITAETEPAGDNVGRLQFGRDLIAGLTTGFSRACEAKVTKLKTELSRFSDSDTKPLLWGAGSKGIMFLNILGLKDVIDYVIDINPHKAGRYIPVTGQLVVGPDFLQDYRPKSIFVANSVYIPEITASLERAKLHPTLIPI